MPEPKRSLTRRLIDRLIRGAAKPDYEIGSAEAWRNELTPTQRGELATLGKDLKRKRAESHRSRPAAPGPGPGPASS